MYYSESHEWIQLKGNVGTVGITDYAQGELGEIVYIELPKVGQKVKANQEICVLESTKAAADVYAPVSGKVIAVNEALRSNPAAINQAAENSSWLFQIEVENSRELDQLMTKDQYLAIVS
jgi:glycine cleavage system H protein